MKRAVREELLCSHGPWRVIAPGAASPLPSLCALGAGLALTAVVFTPRLPQTVEMILPRRFGFSFFRLAAATLARPLIRAALSWGSLALLALAAAVLLTLLYRGAAREWLRVRVMKPRRLAARAGLSLAGLFLLGAAARFALSAALDLIQNAWFPAESVSLWEPLLTFALFSGVAALALRTAGALLEWALSQGAGSRSIGRRFVRLAAWLVGAGLAAWTLGALRYDAAKRTLAEAVPIPESPRAARTVIILTEREGRPDYETHAVELGVRGQTEYSPEALAAVERYAGGRSTVFTRAALRHLYGGYTLQMEPAALRRALLAGHRQGDVLARVLLLDSLSAAPPSPEALSMLKELADEGRWRIGAKGAARLALAFSHLGAGEAKYWEGRAAAGEGAIPRGLLGLEGAGGALKPGLIKGRIAGTKGVKVGLYLRRDPYAPYALGPSQLVDAARTDASGHFRFQGLCAGDYFLAIALDSEQPLTPDRLRLRGHSGDIRLSRKRPKIELPGLRLSF